MNVAEWRQRAVDVLFVVTEAIAWYIMLHVVATGLEQSFLAVVRDRLALALSSMEPQDARRARDVISQLDVAALAEHGPAFLAVVATAAGGFMLMRVLLRYKFDGPLGAIALITASALGLNLLIHLGVSGDLRIWDPSGLLGYANAPDQAFAGEVDLAQFVANPNLGQPHGIGLGAVFIGMVLLWARFAILARSAVTFERVLRSFSIGFVIVLCCVIAARFEGQTAVTVFAVPHFVLGVLGLAVANNARSVVPIEGERRTGPWVAAVGGTVAILAGVAGTLGLLAFVNAGAALNVIGNIAGSILVIVIIVVTTPIFWVLEKLARLLLPADLAQRLEQLRQMQLEALAPPEGLKESAGPLLPVWAQTGLKFLAVVLIGWAIWRIALLVMRRRRGVPPPVDEIRGRAVGGGGLGSLIRGLFPRVNITSSVDWMREQPIYRLYGRAVHEAERRGFRYLPGETPLEFADRAARLIPAPPYDEIGDAFDRARYGRHFPSTEEVRALEGDLQRWEGETPPTEELRARLAGAQPLSEDAETRLMMSRVRQATQRVRRAGRQGQLGNGPGGTPQV